MKSSGFEKIAMVVAFGLVIGLGVYLALSQNSPLSLVSDNNSQELSDSDDNMGELKDLPETTDYEEDPNDSEEPQTKEQTPEESESPAEEPSSDPITVNLEQQFRLAENQVATLTGVGMEIVITNFIYSPCPADAQCIWSGLGIHFEYRLNGQAVFGVNKTTAFGYEVEVVKTNYKTYAELIVRKQ